MEYKYKPERKDFDFYRSFIRFTDDSDDRTREAGSEPGGFDERPDSDDDPDTKKIFRKYIPGTFNHEQDWRDCPYCEEKYGMIEDHSHSSHESQECYEIYERLFNNFIPFTISAPENNSIDTKTSFITDIKLLNDVTKIDSIVIKIYNYYNVITIAELNSTTGFDLSPLIGFPIDYPYIYITLTFTFNSNTDYEHTTFPDFEYSYVVKPKPSKIEKHAFHVPYLTTINKQLIIYYNNSMVKKD